MKEEQRAKLDQVEIDLVHAMRRLRRIQTIDDYGMYAKLNLAKMSLEQDLQFTLDMTGEAVRNLTELMEEEANA